MSGVEAGGKNVVFIVGSPRSGTTWLQRLMGAHGAVVTTQETALIDGYCARLYEVWEQQSPADEEYWQRRRHRGLPSVLTVSEFDELVVAFATDVYARTLALKPGAGVVVDKNPGYSLHIATLRMMFPQSGVIHVVRDGRDVAASLMAARKDWGREWAPRRVHDAASLWVEHVTSAGAAERTGRYLEVRYEDLLSDAGRVLAECFEFARTATSERACRDIVSRFSERALDGVDDSLVWSGEVVRRLGAAPSEPPGFFGSGQPGWTTWSTRDRLAFDAAAGDQMRRLGYVSDDSWTCATWTRRRLEQRRAKTTAGLTRLGWRLHQALGRRGLYVHVAPIEPYE